MIEMNKVYEFECPATFGTLSQERVNKLFTDGRRASGFLELQLEEWFPGLEFVDGKGYDHIYEFNVGQLYDAKCFTKGGANFSPSIMLGGGRRVDEEKLWEHAMDMVYIFCDVVDFPQVRVIFKYGKDLIEYQKGNIPFKDRDLLFADD
tara:strand:+ start:37 stop:483 length:447 start_codon:yes stop_codon:yes gene_type:complete